MAYVALYRKWRPMTFEDVVEQDTVVRILKNAVMSGRIAHAYLFCGTRGTGKTTLAKIFARAVNCEHPQDGNPCNECAVCKGILNQQILDVSEIDAASNNGVDNIRAIIDETAYASSVARYRVYIIDEVHMLSAGAFNALLKTLEEPPADVIFILATTEPHKLPVTILSRCQRYDFKRISQEGIIGRLQTICDASSVTYAPEALGFLAQKADGAMRDAISLLDQAIASCGNRITLAGARAATGSLDKEFLEQFALGLLESDSTTVLELTHRIFTDGRDPSNFIGELMNVYRNMLIVLTVNNPEAFLYEDGAGMKRLKTLCERTNPTELSLFIQALSKLDNNLKWAVQRKIVFEVGMLGLCDRKWNPEDAELESRIAALEERLSDVVAKGIRVGRVTGDTVPVSQTQAEPAPMPSPTVEKNSVQEDELPPESAGRPMAETPKPSGTPVSEPRNACVMRREADLTDWKEFTANLNSKRKASLASLFNMSCHGVLISENTLAAVFHSKMMRDMVSKQNCGELIDACASAAFGRPMQVMLTVEEELDTLDETPAAVQSAPGYAPGPAQEIAPEQKAANEEQISEAPSEDDFEASLKKLKALSEMQGFEFLETEKTEDYEG